MQINLTARHIRASKVLKDHAISKISKLEKFYEGIVWCDVILTAEKTPKNSNKVEVIMRVYRSTLSSTARSDEFMTAVGEAVDKIERQIKKYKSKLRERHKIQKRRTMLAA